MVYVMPLQASLHVLSAAAAARNVYSHSLLLLLLLLLLCRRRCGETKNSSPLLLTHRVSVSSLPYASQLLLAAAEKSERGFRVCRDPKKILLLLIFF